jgi:preprotein translocase subunit SecD
MSRSNNIILLIIIILFGLSVWAIVPDSQLSGLFQRDGMQLGLDLKGGVQLVYKVDFSDNMTTAEKKAAIDGTILKITQRIDKFGVTEPVIEQVGDDRILIQLPGFTDEEAAKSLVEQTGFLEFREVEKNASGAIVYLKDYLKQSQYQFIDINETGNRLFVNMSGDGTEYGKLVAIIARDATGIHLTDATGNATDNTTLAQYGDLASWIPARGTGGVAITGSYLADAQPALTSSNQPVIDIEWNSEGAVLFDQLAARLHNPAGQGGQYSLVYALGIFLDQKLLSAPQLTSQSYEGKGTISGSFTVKSAENLATLLKSGSLPMPLEKPPLFQEKVSATLGAEFVDKSLIAGIIGMALVIIFMIAYYRIPGLMASIALLFYATLSLAIFKLWPITLSLGGIGGFIVSMGIAVDANVLIFERMKEEFRAGRTLGASIEAGFHRAWTAIWDSNMTTFIACIILYWLGSAAMHNSAVIGFAVTLFVGAIVSMFTAVTVTRTLLRAIANTSITKHPSLFTVIGGKK